MAVKVQQTLERYSADQLPAFAHQSFAAGRSDFSSVGVDRVLSLGLVRPVPSSSIRLGDAWADVHLLKVQHLSVE
jgi:hypothetical protein